MTSIDVEKLCDILKELPRKQSTLLIGIDGCGGAGKSTLAKALASSLSGVTIIEMDDFYLPSWLQPDEQSALLAIGSAFDWRRLSNQALMPLRQSRAAKYQRYDWKADNLIEESIVVSDGIVIIEGVYSTRRELADVYDYRIWVECPREIRLERGLVRDGQDARDRWEKVWMPAEDCYVESHKPRENADYVVNSHNE